MTDEDAEARAYVQAKSARMLSRAIYLKLKAVVSSWEREERGKARVASGALLGLLALAAVAMGFGVWRAEYAVVSLLAGFAIWVCFVFWLMRLHLGRERRGGR